jgi:hypothetical protein
MRDPDEVWLVETKCIWARVFCVFAMVADRDFQDEQ